jgi:hypothetical protein
MSLGKQLAKTIRHKEAEAARKIEVAAEAERRRKIQEIEKANRFFDEYKIYITETIIAGKYPKNRRTPSNFFPYGGLAITNDENYLFEIFKRFREWVVNNDLELNVINAHDGMGMDSWWEFSIKVDKNLR